MIYVGIDDTDSLGSPGTGHLARTLGHHLHDSDLGCGLYGITRHQLLIDPRVPYTAKNSCAALHLYAGHGLSLKALADVIADFCAPHFSPGSDPGLAIAADVHVAISAFGQSTQQCVVTATSARGLAKQYGVVLRGLGGTEDGVIGALAAIGLAATGDDGRFIHVGTVRELSGEQHVNAILEAGIREVYDLDHDCAVRKGIVLADKLRPALRQGQPILHVRRHGNVYHPVRFD